MSISKDDPPAELSRTLSEFEVVLNGLVPAFHRWMESCMTAAGAPELSSLDVSVLQHVSHRGEPKRLADICLVLNTKKAHLVNYSLNKLEKRRLIVSERVGKERFAEITRAGDTLCRQYEALRAGLLIKSLRGRDDLPAEIAALADLLRLLIGHYEQAARSATAQW